jgi:hypothetical protein
LCAYPRRKFLQPAADAISPVAFVVSLLNVPVPGALRLMEPAVGSRTSSLRLNIILLTIRGELPLDRISPGVPFGKAACKNKYVRVARFLGCHFSLDGRHSAAAPAIKDYRQVFVRRKKPVGNTGFMFGDKDGPRYVSLPVFISGSRIDHKNGLARGKHGAELFGAHVSGGVKFAGRGATHKQEKKDDDRPRREVSVSCGAIRDSSALQFFFRNMAAILSLASSA